MAHKTASNHPVLTHLCELKDRHVFPVSFSRKVAMPWVDVSEILNPEAKWVNASFFTNIIKHIRVVYRKWLMNKHVFYREASRDRHAQLFLTVHAIHTFWEIVRAHSIGDADQNLLHDRILAFPFPLLVKTQCYIWPVREPYEDMPDFDATADILANVDDRTISCNTETLGFIRTLNATSITTPVAIIKVEAICQSARVVPAEPFLVPWIDFDSQFPKVSQEDVQYLIQSIQQRQPENFQLLHQRGGVLALNNFEIVAKGAKMIADVLMSNTSLLSIDLSQNQIGNPGLVPLAPVLQHNTTITALNLSYNSIGNPGAADLAAALKHNQTLITLSIGHNSISDDGASSLAEALSLNHSLTLVDLSNNDIATNGAAALSAALQMNQSIGTFNLLDNKLGASGATAMADAILNNSTMTTLYLGSNSIGDDGAEAVALALRMNRGLHILGLGSNRIGDAGAIHLAIALEYNSIVTNFDLAYNPISNVGCSALAASLLQNASLMKLDLDFNSVSGEGVAALASMMTHNMTLSTLTLGYNTSRDGGLSLTAQIRSACARNKQAATEKAKLKAVADGFR